VITLLVILAGPRASASARPVSHCSASTGATVLVDFSHWGGPLLRSCGSTPTTGYTLLNQGGWHTSGTVHDGSGFVCRIGYAGFRHGTQYPTSAQQACVNTPPADAYWTYWTVGPGQRTWSYSQVGAMSYHPPPGSINLWIFGATNVAGSSGSAMPTISPAQIRLLVADATTAARAGRPTLVNAPPARTGSPAGHGSYEPAVITLAIVVVLAVLAGAGSMRRRRQRVAR
jgi:hypothetical protein